MAVGCTLMLLMEAARPPLVDVGMTKEEEEEDEEEEGEELMGLEAMGMGVEMGLVVVAKVGTTWP